jgi:drug/metabolite transporter (DMT)-like permease
MSARDLAELVALAALWGASFLFMRLGAGEFGPFALAFVRVALAAAVLLPVVGWRAQWPALRRHWKAIALIGVLNSALPFLAFAYAATAITAGLSSIFNATTPLWGALIAWLWLRERLTGARVLGLAIGFGGVLWLAWDKAGWHPGAAVAVGAVGAAPVLACLGATVCYGFAANAARRFLLEAPPMAVAAGSQCAAAIVLLVPALIAWPAKLPGSRAWVAVVLLGLACTALAYLLYFRLIAHVGAAKAVSVTFLIPMFAVVWGWALLGETATPVMLGACAVIIAGTALATGLVRPGGRLSRA